jgi:hypothetical protein
VKTFDDGGDFEGASDVDRGTLRAFVVAVIYANAAVLLVALGPMVWFFEGWSRVGPALFVVGLLAAIRTYQTYRSWKRSRDEADEDAEAEADADVAETEGNAEVGQNAETDGNAEGDEGDFDPDATPPEA